MKMAKDKMNDPNVQASVLKAASDASATLNWNKERAVTGHKNALCPPW